MTTSPTSTGAATRPSYRATCPGQRIHHPGGRSGARQLIEDVRDIRRALMACAVCGWLAVLVHLAMQAMLRGA